MFAFTRGGGTLSFIASIDVHESNPRPIKSTPVPFLKFTWAWNSYYAYWRTYFEVSIQADIFPKEHFLTWMLLHNNVGKRL